MGGWERCVSDELVRSKRNRPGRQWRVGDVIPCLTALTLLTVPLCCGIEDNPGSKSMIAWAVVNMTYFDTHINETVSELARGRYGLGGLVESESGVAVHVRNKDNKTHGCDEYAVKIPKEKWIAVMERGHCYFTDKIKMATKNYNASAVVIYNHEDDPPFTIMQHSERGEVAVFVSMAVGRRLEELVDSGVQVMISITPDNVRVMISITPDPESSPQTSPPPSQPLPGALWLSLLIAVVVVAVAVTTYCLLFSAHCRKSASRCQTVMCPCVCGHWKPLENDNNAPEPKREVNHPEVC